MDNSQIDELSQLSMALGMGLLTGRNWGDGIGRGLQGYSAGSMERRKAKSAQQQKDAELTANMALIKRYRPELDDASARALAGNGAVLSQVLSEGMKKPDPMDALRQEALQIDIAKGRKDLNAPAPAPDAWSDFADAMGNKFQRNAKTGKVELLQAAPAKEKPQGPMTVAPGATVFDPVARKPVFTAPREPERSAQPTDDMREFEWINGERQKRGEKPLTPEEFMQGKKGGGLEVQTPDGTIMRMGGSGGAKLTEQQSKDGVFYDRGIAANRDLGTGEALTSWTDKVGSGIGSMIGAPNALSSEDYALQDQAAKSFLTSILRKDTGAAITNQEFGLYGPMFLPMPGDTANVLAQKAKSRTLALEAIKDGLNPAQIIERAKREAQSSQGGAQPQQPAPASAAAAIDKARAAIKAGADPEKVKQRLQAAGIDTTGL